MTQTKSFKNFFYQLIWCREVRYSFVAVKQLPTSTMLSAARGGGGIDFFRTYYFVIARQDSSVGKATGFGLDGTGIKSRLGWAVTFPAPVQTSPWAHPASYKMGTWSFSGVERPGRGADNPPHLPPRLNKE